MSAIGQQLIDIVRKKAEENPDFIYNPPGGDGASCVYVYRAKPSCLIGHALWDAGLIDRDFVRVELEKGGRAVRANEEGINHLAPLLGLDLDPLELAWLTDVQDNQDDELSWGWSVRSADAEKERCA